MGHEKQSVIVINALSSGLFVLLPLLISCGSPFKILYDSNQLMFWTKIGTILVIIALLCFLVIFQLSLASKFENVQKNLKSTEEKNNALEKQLSQYERGDILTVKGHDICAEFMVGALRHIAKMWKFTKMERVSIYAQINDGYYCIFRFSPDSVFTDFEYGHKYSDKQSHCIQNQVSASLEKIWHYNIPNSNETRAIHSLSNEARATASSYLNLLQKFFGYNADEVNKMCMRSASYVACTFSHVVGNNVKVRGGLVMESLRPEFFGKINEFKKAISSNDPSDLFRNIKNVESVIDSTKFWMAYANAYHNMKMEIGKKTGNKVSILNV